MNWNGHVENRQYLYDCYVLVLYHMTRLSHQIDIYISLAKYKYWQEQCSIQWNLCTKRPAKVSWLLRISRSIYFGTSRLCRCPQLLIFQVFWLTGFTVANKTLIWIPQKREQDISQEVENFEGWNFCGKVPFFVFKILETIHDIYEYIFTKLSSLVNFMKVSFLLYMPPKAKIL